MALKQIKQSGSGLDFWDKLYEDEDGNLVSPGYVDYTNGNENLWDILQVNVAGKWTVLPGKAVVYFKRSKKKDKKKSVGSDSTTVTTSGTEATEIVIELLMWTPQHWQGWKDLAPKIFPKPGKDGGTQSSFKVQHPLFGPANISAVVFHAYEGPTHGHVSRSKMLRLFCTEYMPQSTKKAGGTAPPPSLAAALSFATLGLSSSVAPPPGAASSGKTGL